MLRQNLDLFDYVRSKIAECDQEIDRCITAKEDPVRPT
jgi:hypothetical protein